MASRNHGTGRPIARAEQAEIPGTESPDRDPELHALWLELVALEEEAATARGDVKNKQAEASAALKKRGLTEYFVDGAQLWIEPHEKIKTRKKGGRAKGKIKKVTAGDQEPAE